MMKSELRELANFSGIENFEEATNALDDEISHDARKKLVERISKSVERVVNRNFSQADPNIVEAVDHSSSQADPNIVRKALQEWKDRLDSVRLMILCGATRGKTFTIASLLRRPFDDERASTQGVDLSIYYLILGQDVHDEQVRQNLARKDKFQSRF